MPWRGLLRRSLIQPSMPATVICSTSTARTRAGLLDHGILVISIRLSFIGAGCYPTPPTFFVRRSVYERYGLFDLSLGSAADYEIMLRFLLRYRLNATYIPQVLVKMRTGGISNASVRNRLLANQMDRKAWQVNDLRPYPWTLWFKPLRKIGQWVVAG